MLLEYLGVLGGLILLIFGADRFVLGAANIARNMGVSPLIIGVSIVGIATSAPEILVSSAAAIDGKTEIAIGNAIGSNIANIGMVLGLTALLKPIMISSKTLRQEYLLMFLSAIIAFSVLFNLDLSRVDSLILMTVLAFFIWWIIQMAKQSLYTDPIVGEFEKELAIVTSLPRSFTLTLIGLLLLLGGAELLINSSVAIANYFGLSDLVIGLTIIAIGTSLPELAAAIMSVIKNEADIAVGNVLGSNMFNMLAVIGIPGLIQPTQYEEAVLYRDLPVMLGLTVLIGLMAFLQKRGRFARIEGIVLLLCFLSYQYWLVSDQLNL
ncbi:MAG: calcium/sodium antiporter [Gammaproteobacteria bacterium]|nr:calcium/sodium antiporter [Gammaproteobacteria bacterium]NIN62469.1 calcium/sodium antiporter [Gammaproteobacteria bacterium]NIO62852.1 calcium/sodium antiporter [Gammaproteobacteria bacterium]NIP49944.1 calcium/sodium antiporter [Gammaproteobacteria bacterium]NIQ12163.1 calcium/sodium antiporter [Gammaproteobacteria bacterium]